MVVVKQKIKICEEKLWGAGEVLYIYNFWARIVRANCCTLQICAYHNLVYLLHFTGRLNDILPPDAFAI
jgi:hypothetical protein